MASEWGIPGASVRSDYERRLARDRERRRRKIPVAIAMVVASGVFAFLAVRFGANVVGHWLVDRFPKPSDRSPGAPVFPPATVTAAATVVGFVAMVGAARAVWSVNPATEARRKGALGEEALGSRLNKLATQGFVILHDRSIPGSRANIDHLVIGPTGVFVVDAKNYSGRISLSRGTLWTGKTPLTKTLSTVGWEGRQAAKAIAPGVGYSLVVEPVISVVGTEVNREGLYVNGVLVVGARDTVRTIAKRPQFLSQESVRRIAEVAVRALPAYMQ